MCDVLLPTGVNPTAVKYIYINIYIVYIYIITRTVITILLEVAVLLSLNSVSHVLEFSSPAIGLLCTSTQRTRPMYKHNLVLYVIPLALSGVLVIQYGEFVY
jgi:hypothetical protein